MKRRMFLKLAGGAAAAHPRSDWIALAESRPPSLPNSEGSNGIGQLPSNWASVHYQWEFPAWVPEAGKHFDMQMYIKGLVDAGVEAVQVLVRAEPGVYHYPTKIGFERDTTGRDWPREVIDEIKRQKVQSKLKLICYFTISWDNSAVKFRPEWFSRDRNDQPIWDKDVFGQNRWAYVCLNSPWREYTFAIMNEVAELYPEFVCYWLDEPMFPNGGCYCRWCEEGIRKDHGYGLPRDPKVDTRQWIEMRQFQVESILRLFEDFKKQVIAKHPRLVWTWNGVTAPCDWEPRIWQAAPLNSHEVQEGYLQALVWAKRFASYGKPFEVTAGRDYTWVDMRIRPEYEIKTLQAISVAHGGGELIGDGPYPDGRIREDGFTWGKNIFNWKRSIQPWLDKAQNLSDVALFDSWDSAWARFVQRLNPEKGFTSFEEYFLPFYSWAKLLSAANIQFDVLSESSLDSITKYQAVILPDQIQLQDSTVEALEKYVQAGGRLLATFRTGLYNREGEQSPSVHLWKLLGLKFREFSAYKGNYMRLSDSALKKDLIPDPLLVLGTAVVCEATTAKPLAHLTYPIGELGSETRVWFDYNPPSAESSPYVSASINQWGKGKALYIAHPIEERYLRGSYWALGQLLLNAVDLLVPERLIRIVAPTEVRAITTVQNEKRRVMVHLLNEADWTSTAYLTHAQATGQERRDIRMTNQSPYPWKHPAVANVQIELKTPFGSASRVYLAPDGRVLTFEVKAGRLVLTVPRVDTHTVVVVEK